MSEATVRAFSGERRASAEVKDPADQDTLGGEAPAAPGSVRRVSPCDEVVRQPVDEGVATCGDARRELLDAVTKSLDSKGVDAE
ncbi:hypothetical protein ADK41_13295 [Streptomyces caelestis]|uniref:Uncharacterized protein n=2 Tax=Streptomyces TaxID=1883 RepID=A0A0M8QSV3_9ACTN|nr:MULTISPECIES: hypothetical protein [Streptomyces]KOT39769.1 hypothetical protein ADK41_13295 [Streptomyces caelestis]KOV21152.1 hypothetical protein ADK58_32405 [Streptomyces sp. XY152]